MFPECREEAKAFQTQAFLFELICLDATNSKTIGFVRFGVGRDRPCAVRQPQHRARRRLHETQWRCGVRLGSSNFIGSHGLHREWVRSGGPGGGDDSAQKRRAIFWAHTHDRAGGLRPYLGLDLAYLHVFLAEESNFVGLAPNGGVDFFVSDTWSLGLRGYFNAYYWINRSLQTSLGASLGASAYF
jgi:hypothetical protein